MYQNILKIKKNNQEIENNIKEINNTLEKIDIMFEYDEMINNIYIVSISIITLLFFI